MTIILTSKPAKKDFEKIKAQHAEIVQGLAEHTQRVQALNQQRNEDLKKTQQENFDRAQQSAQTDIKRAAIATKV